MYCVWAQCQLCSLYPVGKTFLGFKTWEYCLPCNSEWAPLIDHTNRIAVVTANSIIYRYINLYTQVFQLIKYPPLKIDSNSSISFGKWCCSSQHKVSCYLGAPSPPLGKVSDSGDEVKGHLVRHVGVMLVVRVGVNKLPNPCSSGQQFTCRTKDISLQSRLSQLVVQVQDVYILYLSDKSPFGRWGQLTLGKMTILHSMHLYHLIQHSQMCKLIRLLINIKLLHAVWPISAFTETIIYVC